MYRWLILLLRTLFPLDPVARLREGTRFFISGVLAHLNDRREELEASPEDRAIFEGMVASAEEGLKLLIHERAIQILGHPYAYTRRPLEYPPRRARDLTLIIARLNRVLALQDRVEALAQRRAMRMHRELEANPLGLADTMMTIRANHDDRAIIIIPLNPHDGLAPKRSEGGWGQPQLCARPSVLIPFPKTKTARLATCEVAPARLRCKSQLLIRPRTNKSGPRVQTRNSAGTSPES